MREQRTIRFREYQERFFEEATLSAEEVDRIAHLYGRASADEEDGSQGRQFEVEYLPGAGHARWRVQAQGWVGHIPVTPDLTLVVRPKVPVGNLFRMWEYAYDLRGVEFPEGLTHSGTSTSCTRSWRAIWRRACSARARKGFYRDYRSEDDNLAVVRGRIDLRRLARAPWTVNLDCHFQEHTGDVEENRLLAWTLYAIGRSGICTEDVAPIVRQAYRAVQSFTTLEHYHSLGVPVRVATTASTATTSRCTRSAGSSWPTPARTTRWARPRWCRSCSRCRSCSSCSSPGG